MKLKTLLNETDWITDLHDLNVCESWKFLCYVLNLQWNHLFQGTIELNPENCHFFNHKVIGLKHKKKLQ